MELNASKRNSRFFRLLTALIYFISVVIPLWPALLNGYVLAYPDTGAYIYSGHTGNVPVDRPLMYGFLLRHISLSWSLWPMIIFHSVTITFLLRELIAKFTEFNSLRLAINTGVTVLLLSLITALPYHVCQAIPDILSACTVIIFFLLVSHRGQWSINEYLMLGLFVLFFPTHASNLPVMLLTVFLFMLAQWLIYRNRMMFNSLLLLSFMILFTGWLSGAGLHYIKSKQFVFSRGAHMFLMGRMLESGVLKPYLNDKCVNENLSLCERKEHLPEKAFQFLWEGGVYYDEQCMNQGGWENCWNIRQKEYMGMLLDMVTHQPYAGMIIKTSVMESWRQFYMFHCDDLPPMKEAVYPLIRDFYPDDQHQFEQAKQFNETLRFDTMSNIQLVAVIIGSVVLLVLLLFRQLPQIYVSALMFFVFSLISNAIVCGAISNVVNRYQGRLIWLIPLLVTVFALHKFNRSTRV
jgi:hypothetical protein